MAIDGNRAIIGSPGKNGSEGTAYIFEKLTTGWTEMASFTADVPASGDSFGASVAIDGTLAVVGSPRDDDNAINSGSAFVFEMQGGAWDQVAKLHASDPNTDDSFGGSVAVSEGRIVVGAQSADDFGSSSGKAYVFELQEGSWIQMKILLPSDETSASLNFGEVAIEGDTIAVGAHANDRGAGDSVYIYEHQNNDWLETAIFRSPNPIGLDGNQGTFGHKVDISDDLILVGDSEVTSSAGGDPDPGAAYVYQRVDDVWGATPVQELRASDGAGSDSFSVGAGLDGTTVVVGASRNDTLDGINSGSAYVYNLTPDDWIV